jgi:hypothetical protein
MGSIEPRDKEINGKRAYGKKDKPHPFRAANRACAERKILRGSAGLAIVANFRDVTIPVGMPIIFSKMVNAELAETA